MEEDTIRWSVLSWSLIARMYIVKIVKMANLLKSVYRYNVMPIQSLTHFLLTLKEQFSTSYRKAKNTGKLKQS